MLSNNSFGTSVFLYNSAIADCNMNASNAFDNGLYLSYFQKTFVKEGSLFRIDQISNDCVAFIFYWEK